MSQCEKLNEGLLEWDSWYRGAPEPYRDDPFMAGAMPICVSVAYGQNQDIMTEGVPMSTHRLTWSNQRDYNEARFVSFALASHIK